MDETGRLALEQVISEGSRGEQLQVSLLPRGIYYLQIKTTQLSQYQKIVLQ
jgi:hypothetical protein